jgi:hypothetical protein
MKGDRYWLWHGSDGTTRRVHVPAGDPVEVEYAALADLLTMAGFIEDKATELVDELTGETP